MFFVLSRAWDKEKNYLSSLLFYLQKHDDVDILAVCWTRVMYELRNRPRPPESLWLSGRVSKRGNRRSEVPFLMGTQNFFFVPRS